MLENKEVYKHDFDGDYAPTQWHSPGKTFSVGIFQWLPYASCKGLKRSAVKYRVRGLVSSPGPVYQRAREICKILDKGWVMDKKSETVK